MLNRTIHLGNRPVGDGHPVLISLEAGATHTGIESAKELAKAAADGGADAIKWQTVYADELMADRSQMIKYKTDKGEEREESVYAALKRRELSSDEWRELKDYCSELGLLFISTPDSQKTVDLLAEIGADAIKVSKSDINHFYLVDYMAKTGLPVILDGREKFDDVERCIGILESNQNQNIVIMHCPSGYPAEHAGIHLNTLPQIKNIFGLPAAYSDHSVGEAMNFAAIALGANMLEKTITLDRGTDAVEHSMSLEPHEISGFVQRIRDVEAAMGDPRIIFNSRVKPDACRSMFAARDIAEGESLSIDDIAFRRPGTHYAAEFYDQVVGKNATRNIPAGEPIMPADVA